ncbi:MAG: tetratricopeptide repeat protein, partial [Anaerolineales bacterium]
MRSFTRSPTSARLLLGVLAGLSIALAGPGSVAAQLGAGVRPAKLEPTSTSEAAKTAFWTAIDHFNNIEFATGATHMRRALEVDPGFGLARVAYGLNAPGLSAAERDSTIARGVADAARASPLEALVAMGLREFRGDRERGRTILKSAATIAPGDPNIAFYVAQLSTNAGETAIAMRDVTVRFPDFAPAYNLLAYNLWTIRDRAGALEAAANYMAKAPNHPNSHDTYAEILQFSGRFDEAIVHYQKALEMDPTNTEGAVGMAEVYTLQGKGDQARAAIMGVMDRVT